MRIRSFGDRFSPGGRGGALLTLAAVLWVSDAALRAGEAAPDESGTPRILGISLHRVWNVLIRGGGSGRDDQPTDRVGVLLAASMHLPPAWLAEDGADCYWQAAGTYDGGPDTPPVSPNLPLRLPRNYFTASGSDASWVSPQRERARWLEEHPGIAPPAASAPGRAAVLSVVADTLRALPPGRVSLRWARVAERKELRWNKDGPWLDAPLEAGPYRITPRSVKYYEQDRLCLDFERIDPAAPAPGNPRDLALGWTDARFDYPKEGEEAPNAKRRPLAEKFSRVWSEIPGQPPRPEGERPDHYPARILLWGEVEKMTGFSLFVPTRVETGTLTHTVEQPLPLPTAALADAAIPAGPRGLRLAAAGGYVFECLALRAEGAGDPGARLAANGLLSMKSPWLSLYPQTADEQPDPDFRLTLSGRVTLPENSMVALLVSRMSGVATTETGERLSLSPPPKSAGPLPGDIDPQTDAGLVSAVFALPKRPADRITEVSLTATMAEVTEWKEATLPLVWNKNGYPEPRMDGPVRLAQVWANNRNSYSGAHTALVVVDPLVLPEPAELFFGTIGIEPLTDQGTTKANHKQMGWDWSPSALHAFRRGLPPSPLVALGRPPGESDVPGPWYWRATFVKQGFDEDIPARLRIRYPVRGTAVNKTFTLRDLPLPRSLATPRFDALGRAAEICELAPDLAEAVAGD